MSKSRDALGTVLTGLRELLKTGVIAPGTILSISDLANRYRVSVTPVREALSRLAGEGVLRATRRLGYERPLLLAEDLRQLYAFREMLLLGALGLAGMRLTDAEPTRGRIATVDLLFETLIGAAGNAPLARSFANTTVLLAPAITAEQTLFDDPDPELATLGKAYISRSDVSLQEGLRAFHARRVNAAVLLADLLCAAPAPLA